MSSKIITRFDLYKIGIGFDIHALSEGSILKIGGVEIPHSKGLIGHSDADVLVHAIMDAILGACALGDIGQHFPDTSLKYKNANSIELLDQVYKLATWNLTVELPMYKTRRRMKSLQLYKCNNTKRLKCVTKYKDI